MSKKSPDPVDVHVGQRIRTRRLSAGLSQTALADGLGITFQQVQKYELGANRVGAGRLSAIARRLGVDISFFYEGAPGAGAKQDDAALPDFATELITSRQGVELARAFTAIKSERGRSAILVLARALAER